MGANSDEPYSDEATNAKIQRMTDRAESLGPGEDLNLDEMPETPKTPYELYQKGYLQTGGGKQHAFADAQARGVFNSTPETKVDRMIEQGRTLAEDEKIEVNTKHGHDGPGLVAQLRAGNLTSPGARQHALYLADLQSESGNDPEQEG